MATLEQILRSANSTLDLEYGVPVGSELETRSNFANDCVFETADLYQLEEFNQELIVASNSTITLSNYRELVDTPREDIGNGNFIDYPRINWLERSSKLPSDKYCYLEGNPASGMKLKFNGLSSGTTLTILHQRYPSGMATLSNICELKSSEFVKWDVIYKVLFSRSDPRFPSAEAKRNTLLQNMIGRSMIRSNGGINRTPSSYKNPLS